MNLHLAQMDFVKGIRDKKQWALGLLVGQSPGALDNNCLGFLQSLVNWDLGFTVPFVVWSLSSPAKRRTNASPCLATSASSVSFPLHGWIKLIRGIGNDFAFAFFRSLTQMSDLKPHGLIHDYYYVFRMKCEQNEQKNPTFNLGDEERRRL